MIQKSTICHIHCRGIHSIRRTSSRKTSENPITMQAIIKSASYPVPETGSLDVDRVKVQSLALIQSATIRRIAERASRPSAQSPPTKSSRVFILSRITARIGRGHDHTFRSRRRQPSPLSLHYLLEEDTQQGGEESDNNSEDDHLGSSTASESCFTSASTDRWSNSFRGKRTTSPTTGGDDEHRETISSICESFARSMAHERSSRR